MLRQLKLVVKGVCIYCVKTVRRWQNRRCLSICPIPPLLWVLAVVVLRFVNQTDLKWFPGPTKAYRRLLLRVFIDGHLRFFFLASWNMAGAENVSQLYISHKSCRIKYILSRALASQRRTLTICGILFDAVCFKSCSLHERSKQWIEQSSSLSPSLARSSESSSITRTTSVLT